MGSDGHDTRAIGVLAALPGELGLLRERAEPCARRFGVEILRAQIAGRTVLACVGGVGKVAAARAAAALVAEGAERALFVVGTCGSLRRALPVGELVHCERAMQVDLAARDDREASPDPVLLAAWRAVAPGRLGWYLTADRPVLTFWRRARLARAFTGDCVAEMETAAAAAIAERAGIPWAALRAVTDGAGVLGATEFRRHYAAQAGRAADTLNALVAALDRPMEPS